MSTMVTSISKRRRSKEG